MPHSHFYLLLLVTCTVVAFSEAASWAQTAERELVVTVVDRDGEPVSGLVPDDLRIREDGARREVLRISQDTEPRQVALLVDTSQATANAIADFRAGILAFVTEMGGEHDIALISYGGPPRILVPSTRDAERLEEGIGQIFSYAATSAYLLDALRETTDGFVRRDAPRPVIVVLAAEGLDQSYADSTSVLRGLEDSAVSVHTIVLLERGLTSQAVTPSGFGNLDAGSFAQWRLDRDQGLNLAPLRTGGTRRDLFTSRAADRALREVANEIRNQYLVVYARPATLVPPDNLEVDATREGLTVRRAPVRTQ